MSTQTPLQPFRVSNDALQDSALLQSRMKDEGYLFFQGLITQERIQAVRKEILTLCEQQGWLKEGTSMEEGVAKPGAVFVEPEPAYMALYNELIKGEAFHDLALDPPLVNLLASLFGEPALAHSRNIARIIFPQNTQFTTPSHQDYIHIQGTMETYTAWIPLGDCPQELGSLAVLAGSHKAGVLPVQAAYGAGGVGIRTDDLPYQWVGSDFASGDVVLFQSLTVHKALPNLNTERLRLSVDFRYQPLSHPVHPSSLLPHHNQITWEEVYADWKKETHQYYWKRLPLNYAGQDEALLELRRAAAETRPEDFKE